MKKYYCNGKKSFCDKPNINMCSFCEFTNGEGGKEVEIPNTNYDRIRNMSVEELAMRILAIDQNEDFSCEKYCAYTKNGVCDKFLGDGKASCKLGIKQWLESEVTEE